MAKSTLAYADENYSKLKINEWISRQLTPCSVIHYRDVKNAQNKTNQRANIMISVLF